MENILRVKRAERRLTQLDVVDALHESGLTTSASRYSLIENDRVDPADEEQAALATFFGVSKAVLFPGLESSSTPSSATEAIR